MSPHLAAAAMYIAARERQLMIEEVAEAASVSEPAVERRLKELGIRPIYTRVQRPSEEGRPTKTRKSSNEMAILGPYVLRKAARKKSDFALRGELALELAYNLYEAGVITDEKLAEVEEIARGRVEWYISMGRLALMELGAEFVKPKEARRRGNEQESRLDDDIELIIDAYIPVPGAPWRKPYDEELLKAREAAERHLRRVRVREPGMEMKGRAIIIYPP